MPFFFWEEISCLNKYINCLFLFIVIIHRIPWHSYTLFQNPLWNISFSFISQLLNTPIIFSATKNNLWYTSPPNLLQAYQLYITFWLWSNFRRLLISGWLCTQSFIQGRARLSFLSSLKFGDQCYWDESTMIPQGKPHHRYCTERNRMYRDGYDMILTLNRNKPQITWNRCERCIKKGRKNISQKHY